MLRFVDDVEFNLRPEAADHRGAIGFARGLLRLRRQPQPRGEAARAAARAGCDRVAHVMPAQAEIEPVEITLRDGRSVHLRALQSTDADELMQAFGRLSENTRYLRFMRAVTRLDAGELRRSLAQLLERGLAIVATVPAADGIDVSRRSELRRPDRPAGGPSDQEQEVLWCPGASNVVPGATPGRCRTRARGVRVMDRCRPEAGRRGRLSGRHR